MFGRVTFGMAALAISCAITVSAAVLLVREQRLAGVMAADQARKERDAFWRAEIEKSNAEIERAQASQLRAAIAAADEAQASEEAIRRELIERSKDDASLPSDTRCGLSHDRVRLLIR